MLPAITTTKTMSSLEIAELVNSRHDDVKRSIERLASDLFNPDGSIKRKAVIAYPPLADVQEVGGNNRSYTTQVYLFSGEQGKRDSIIVVAQLSPEFTAALVDRWQELESQQIPKTLPEALRLAADLAERNAALENKIEADLPKVEFAMAVRRMEGSCKIGDFGKVIGIGRNKLFARMRADEILMADNMPYQRYIDQELFVVIEQTPFTDRDGKAHPRFTTMVTGKGQVWLERKYRISTNCFDK